MTREAQLENAGSGLVPASGGWYVLNAHDAAWVVHDVFGARCTFDASPRALRDRPDLEPRVFRDVGHTLCVLQPGERSGLYHAETMEESFLVLRGTCLLLVAGEERTLREWDFLHCPPGTAHAFVGAGDGPCAIFMSGGRAPGRGIVYPRSEFALGHEAGVEQETDSPYEAYAPYAHWRPGRPDLPF